MSYLAIKRNGPVTSTPRMVLHRALLREKSPRGYMLYGAIYRLFFLKFLLLFNYSCMPFLPIPPPHPS